MRKREEVRNKIVRDNIVELKIVVSKPRPKINLKAYVHKIMRLG